MIRLRRQLGDDGYATIATAGFAAALLTLYAAVGAAAALVIAHHEAQVAADLAAVAGAFAVYRGEDACGAADAVAGYNGASIRTCTVSGADVTVSAVVRGREVSSTAGPV
ncbi:Rv3654c family TadE-like protein [Corynebacterium suedekumii]|uniref:Rv3654c family TadE-like protein n=1 Tax=Corynebacterium suedekumii TaxID=3049801 RepID=UPI0032C42480